MNVYDSENIRNVVLLGHGGSGKTILLEGLAYAAGMINRIKTIEEGGTISDYDKEELKRKFSIQTSVVPIEYDGIKINLLDTPGFFDFSGEVYEALSVADAAIICISGTDGVQVGTQRAFEYCKEYNIPCMVLVSNIDSENADLIGVVEDLKGLVGPQIAPFQLPLIEDDKFMGFINVVKNAGRRYNPDGTYESYDIEEGEVDDLDEARDMLMEAVAGTDDDYMDRYFEGDTFTQEEISTALRQTVIEGETIPVLMGSSVMRYGPHAVLLAIKKYFPSPVKDNVIWHGVNQKTEEAYVAEYDPFKPTSAYIFKTVVDPFVGKFSLIKVCDGVVKPNTVLYNAEKDEEERIGKLYVLKGRESIEVSELRAGDIGAIAKLNISQTRDTLSTKATPIVYEKTYVPTPYTFSAYVTKKRGEEDKASAAIKRLMEEDLTLREVNDKENRQMLIYGLGDQHLEVVVSKLADRYKVEIELVKPRIAYKETILGKVEKQGKYKKQSGGHGQYGDVKMSFEPSGDLDKAYIFEEKIFGGAVPKNYFPAVEKGIVESCEAGPLAGYPVVGIKATLLDGSYHPVDSSELAFKQAAKMAFKAGVMEAHPVLLEPIVSLKVVIPDAYTGDIMGDLTKRRGRVLGMNPVEGGKTEILADIPQGSLVGYSTTLRSTTGGSGTYSYEFSAYEQMPVDAQNKVLEEAAKDK
ncbi:MAG: elongation factor G [Lachnospiraceae bacterium]|nr:elongation factor G [Lachnospiraceae bacterium]